jgi:hypothetical protein
MSPTTPSYRHATGDKTTIPSLAHTVSPDSEAHYVNIDFVKNRGRPVSLEPSIAENSDEDYPQDHELVPSTDSDRVLHLPLQAADMSLAAAAAPYPIQESCSTRIAVEHVDTSSETSRVSPRALPAATQPQVYLSEVTRQFVRTVFEKIFLFIHIHLFCA